MSAIAARALVESAEPIHVLVADDEPMLRGIIAEFLDSLAFVTHAEVADGAEALAYIRAHPVDCLLSDIRMPRMDLRAVLAVLREEDLPPAVIATSGYSDPATAAEILRQGAVDFLAKPLDLDRLEGALAWVARRGRFLAGLAGQVSNGGRPATKAAQRVLPEAFLEAPGGLGERFRHAERTARLVEAAFDADEARALGRLRCAALLHEIGASSQYLDLIAAPRSLHGAELACVRCHAQVGARLLKTALGASAVPSVVEGHLDWMRSASREGSGEEVEVATQRLGALNAVDALLSPRADRPPLGVAAARKAFEATHGEARPCVLGPILDRWNAIAEFHADLMEGLPMGAAE